MNFEQKVDSYEDLHKLLKVIESCVKPSQLEVASRMKDAFFKKHPWMVDKIGFRIKSIFIEKRKKLKPKFSYRWC